jgi:nicotinate-nucleotide adenylyltransferase
VLCVAARGSGEGVAQLQALPGVRVVVLRLPQMPESATDIRARLAAGRDITDLVAPPVASYIASQHLYEPT